MKQTSFLMMLAALFGLSAFQSNAVEPAIIVGNASYTNSLVVSKRPTKIYAVMGYNSGPSQFVQVFDKPSVPDTVSTDNVLDGAVYSPTKTGLYLITNLQAGATYNLTIGNAVELQRYLNSSWQTLLTANGQFVNDTNFSYRLVGPTDASPTGPYPQVAITASMTGVVTVPRFSFPVASGQFYSFDFSAYGVDMDAVTVCNSTTGNTLTLGAADCGIQAIKSK